MPYIVPEELIPEDLTGHIYVNCFAQDAALIYRAMVNMKIIPEGGISDKQLSALLDVFLPLTKISLLFSDEQTYV